MTKVHDLLEKLAPKGVPFIALGDVAIIQTGQAFDKTKLGGHYAVWNGGVTSNQFLAESNTPGDTITIPARGSVGIVGYQENDFWCGPLCYRIRFRDTELSNRYLFFFLKSIEPTIKSLQQSGSIPALNKKELESVRIPIPPASVQIAIVKILDKFTELRASLEAELDARKIQYGFYRNQLLSLDEREVPFSDLSDLYDFQYGMGNTIPTSGGEYPVYGSNGIVGTHSEFNSEDAPIIGHIGAYAGIINWASGKHFVTYNGVICLIKKGHHPRFGYHLLNSLNLRELANAGSQPFVSYDKLEKVQVQLPKIDVQIQIAKYLDSFEILTKDTQIGLPAEMEARRQQFEHYLDRLLTFRELTLA